MFIGTQFSNLYTLVDTSARGRVGDKIFMYIKYLCTYLNMYVCVCVYVYVYGADLLQEYI